MINDELMIFFTFIHMSTVVIVFRRLVFVSEILITKLAHKDVFVFNDTRLTFGMFNGKSKFLELFVTKLAFQSINIVAEFFTSFHVFLEGKCSSVASILSKVT